MGLRAPRNRLRRRWFRLQQPKVAALRTEHQLTIIALLLAAAGMSAAVFVAMNPGLFSRSKPDDSSVTAPAGRYPAP